MSDRLDALAWTAKRLVPEAKASYFRGALSLRARKFLLSKWAMRASIAMFSVGLALSVGTGVFWIVWPIVHPAPPPIYYGVDHSTGVITEPVSIRDAADRLFGEATDEAELKRYIKACWEWIPDVDREHDHVCKLMSSAEQQARYMDWRANPANPPKAIGKKGHVDFEFFRFHPKGMDEATKTRRYWVQIRRNVWLGTTKESSKEWSASIDFQYHPEDPMLPIDRPDNKSGFQAVNADLTQDTPDNAAQGGK